MPVCNFPSAGLHLPKLSSVSPADTPSKLMVVVWSHASRAAFSRRCRGSASLSILYPTTVRYALRELRVELPSSPSRFEVFRVRDALEIRVISSNK